MIAETNGRWYPSKPYTMGDGSDIPIDLSFLNSAMRSMSAPCVREMLLVAAVNVDTAGGGSVAAEDWAKVLSRITGRDKGGYWYDLPGSLSRLAAQADRGSRATDPTALGASQSGAARNVMFRISFEPDGRSARAKDFRKPLIELVDGGDFNVTCNADLTAIGTGVTFNSGTVKLWVRVVDERRRELKSRLVWRNINQTVTEDEYKVNGSLRCAFFAAPAATGYTTIAGYTSIDSRDLEYVALADSVLREAYSRDTPDPYSADGFADGATALPLFWPSPDQRTGMLPDLDTLHIKMVEGSVATGAKLVVCVVENRALAYSVPWMGYASAADFQQAFLSRGYVVDKGGKTSHQKYWGDKLTRRLPVRIKSPAEVEAAKAKRA